MHKTLLTQRLLALFGLGWVVLHFPLLTIWDSGALLWGMPLFPLALFVLWGLLIAALAWLMENDPNDGRD